MRLIDADLLKSQEELGKVFKNPTDELYGMLEIIDSQPTYPQWIKCSDKLPENTIKCYITMMHTESNIPFVTTITYRDNKWIWDNGRILSDKFKVVAWQKIKYPQPYKEELK